MILSNRKKLMSKKQKLELTWIGKDKRPRLEPRILLEDKSLSYRATEKGLQGSGAEDLRGFKNLVGLGAHNDNLLIHGDNLLALKALEQQYAGKVKCVFIDPPYNTGSAFTHYDDGLEHSLWLSLMRDRLEAIRTLLAEDASLWITIDDNEAHYLKVLCDEVFGRGNFVSNIIWEKSDSPRNSARQFSTDHDHLLVFSKNPDWIPKKLARTDASNSIYSNPDNDPRGPWLPGDPYANKPYSKGQYSIVGATGREFSPPPGRFWRISEEKLRELDKDGRIWWGPTGNARPSIKRYLTEVGDLVPRTLWTKGDVGSNRTSKNEMRGLFPGASSFDTPKPERLIERVLNIATNLGDLVLDSFAGSGTTGAVAHKMGRRWIMVELGEHCQTHIVPRLKKVIDGEDQGGISKTVNWQGGGGFRYFRLAPSLLKKDTWGNWIINKAYNAEMLSEAMCKHMGFQYAPSQAHFWMHGNSTETDFIYVTTGSLSHDQLKVISDEVGNNCTLLICCKAFMAETDAFANLTLKKIPQAILTKCEWDHDDYSFSLNVLSDETSENLESSPDSDSYSEAD
jgi:adenine-specific DNA-methyltransferase